MKIEILDSFESVSEAQLVEFEKDFRCVLPNEYRTFLEQNNGGMPSLHDFKVNGEYFCDIGWFFGVRGYLATHDIKTENIEARELMPDSYLAIGVSYGGNLICLCIDNTDYGAVYCWDHELANYDGPASDDCMLKISDTFGEFLCSLYTEE